MSSADARLKHPSAASSVVQPARPVPRQLAELHDAALDHVQKLLTAHGIHARCVERLDITARRGEEEPLIESRRYAPQLLVFADGGWRVATISVAAGSGAYLVELAQWGQNNEPRPDKVKLIPVGYPQWVASLIPGYRQSPS